MTANRPVLDACCGKSRRGFTFAGPHRERTVAGMPGMEVEQHQEIMETL